jgi:post-segregation antitoxin (ccd killing protein)
MITQVFNNEFKLYLTNKGINIDVAMFDLTIQPPQNFASYRQAELDSNRISTFTQMQQVPFISNRFALQRFLGMSKEEVAENERMWREENDEFFSAGPTDAAAQLRDAGISGSDISDDTEAAMGDELDDNDPITGDAGDVGGSGGGTPDTTPEA